MKLEINKDYVMFDTYHGYNSVIANELRKLGYGVTHENGHLEISLLIGKPGRNKYIKSMSREEAIDNLLKVEEIITKIKLGERCEEIEKEYKFIEIENKISAIIDRLNKLEKR